MKQSSLGLGTSTKRTRRREFLDEMDRVVPWSDLVAQIAPFMPDGKRGRNCMRLNFSFESPENIREAIRRLAEVVEDRLELYRAFIAAGAIKE